MRLPSHHFFLSPRKRADHVIAMQLGSQKHKERVHFLLLLWLVSLYMALLHIGCKRILFYGLVRRAFWFILRVDLARHVSALRTCKEWFYRKQNDCFVVLQSNLHIYDANNNLDAKFWGTGLEAVIIMNCCLHSFTVVISLLQSAKMVLDNQRSRVCISIHVEFPVMRLMNKVDSRSLK